MNSQQQFNEGLRTKLAAEGFTENEMLLGALTAELKAALKMINNPLAALALSNTGSKMLALLTQHANAAAERVCQASDIIFESVMAKTAELVPAVTVRRLDDTPANDPKDIN